MVLAVTYPWASASSFVTTAGDATPLWEDVTDPTCSGDRHRAFAPFYLASFCDAVATWHTGIFEGEEKVVS